MTRLSTLFLTIAFWTPAAPAQPPVEKDNDTRTLETLRTLGETIFQIENELGNKRSVLETLPEGLQKKTLLEEIEEREQALTKLRTDFETVSTGVPPEVFAEESGASFDLQKETEILLLPLIDELKELTSKPREIEALRSAVALQQKRLQSTRNALNSIRTLQTKAADKSLQSRLNEGAVAWESRQNQITTALSVAQFQLEQAEKNDTGIIDMFRNGFARFFRSRGGNLLLAVASALTVFTLFRTIHRLLHRWSPLRKRGKRSLAVRLLDILYYAATVIGTTLSALAILYLTGDWVLLGVAALFLLGIAWAGKHTVPIFYEQAKLMMNIGSVREGERILYNGLPWEIQTINIYTELVNPQLEGGSLRIPIKDLIPLHSRPFDPKETWFPSNTGDWVKLSDDSFGKIISQSPEWVRMVMLGGSSKTFPTTGFTSLNPEVLSRSFRIRSTFGIDYQHQKHALEEIPEKLKLHVARALENIVDKEAIKHIKVEFLQANSSSLDYMVLADFSGSAAPKHNHLERAIQAGCVAACNEHGWVIPFPQLTLHQTGDTSSP